MIANDQQLAIVARQVEELRTARDRAHEDNADNPFWQQIEVAGFDKMIARLQEEIEAYENARAGKLPPVLTARVRDDDLGEVAEALVQLRVARGLRQEDIAKLVDKQQPSIARWEDEEYQGYTLRELARLAAALGRELHVSFVVAGGREKQPEVEEGDQVAPPAVAINE